MLKLQFQFGIAILGENHTRIKLRLLMREMFDFGDYKLRDVKIDAPSCLDVYSPGFTAFTTSDTPVCISRILRLISA